jgi:hypothetical protein
MTEFNVWTGACSHVLTDIDASHHPGIERNTRESFADPIRHSEGFGPDSAPSFDWDIMLHLGDLNRGHPDTPDDNDGREIHRQWSTMRKHRREQIYNLLGNHDASGPDEPTQWWFKKWVDPLGENTEISGVDNERRPFPISGTWERYSFQAGNILFLMMGDRNDLGPPVGRSKESGGFPAGAVTEETFEWWREKVEANEDKIIITCHHHMLKDTTVASGEWEGLMGNYHGYMPDGAPEGSSYLYFISEEPDANAFENYLEENPGAIDMWLGGHTHALPDDTFGGKSHVERKWDVSFINVAPMTKYHGAAMDRIAFTPLTRLFSFIPGESLATVRCYLHTDDFSSIGWYEDAQRNIPLRHPFSNPA